jgi:CDP-diacylglycerol--glycerol-3-phosphate 3-phosphatidyltransferase
VAPTAAELEARIRAHALGPRPQAALPGPAAAAAARPAGLGFTANGLTLLALLGSLALGAPVGWRAPSDPRWLVALPLWLFARMALNALDGMLARELDMQSDLGAVERR